MYKEKGPGMVGGKSASPADQGKSIDLVGEDECARFLNVAWGDVLT